MSQKASAVKRAQQSEVQPHQPGQEVFKTILSEDVVETVPGVPTFRAAGVVVGSAVGARPLHNQGQSRSSKQQLVGGVCAT
jgi:hypothetical protein